MLLKPLIAVASCWKFDYGINQDEAPRYTGDRLTACRQTWLSEIPEDNRRVFFGVGGITGKPDEVVLQVPDDYRSLPLKTREICKWALENDYTHVFRTDDDTYCYPNRILAGGYEHHDYSGYCLEYPPPFDNARYCGAPGFWLSSRAMEAILANYKLDHYADDLWIGKTLYAAGIKAFRDTRYVPGFTNHFVDVGNLPLEHPYIALHSVTPEMMYQAHSRGVTGQFHQAPEKTYQEPKFDYSIYYKKAI